MAYRVSRGASDLFTYLTHVDMVRCGYFRTTFVWWVALQQKRYNLLCTVESPS